MRNKHGRAFAATTPVLTQPAGGRVTSGDVAARAGLPLAQTSTALNALAADTGATLQVSSAGDLLYVFAAGVRAQLAAKSWRLRLAPGLAKARGRRATACVGTTLTLARSSLPCV